MYLRVKMKSDHQTAYYRRSVVDFVSQQLAVQRVFGFCSGVEIWYIFRFGVNLDKSLILGLMIRDLRR